MQYTSYHQHFPRLNFTRLQRESGFPQMSSLGNRVSNFPTERNYYPQNSVLESANCLTQRERVATSFQEELEMINIKLKLDLLSLKLNNLGNIVGKVDEGSKGKRLRTRNFINRKPKNYFGVSDTSSFRGCCVSERVNHYFHNNNSDEEDLSDIANDIIETLDDEGDKNKKKIMTLKRELQDEVEFSDEKGRIYRVNKKYIKEGGDSEFEEDKKKTLENILKTENIKENSKENNENVIPVNKPETNLENIKIDNEELQGDKK